jgi:YD repeat-containing protein
LTKPIAIKNEYGETIEIKWDDEGNIQVRRSDIDKERFGQRRELTKWSRLPEVKNSLKARGVDMKNPEIAALLGRLGSLLVIDGQKFTINAEETALILDTVKRNGGILPNWSSRP